MDDREQGYTGEVEISDRVMTYKDGRLIEVRLSEKKKLKHQVHEAAKRGFSDLGPSEPRQ